MVVPMKLHSYTITQGRDRAPARAMLKAIGFTDEDLKKPIIGIANTWIETMPCNFNLRELAAHVKAGVRAAGGTPMEFNTIAISDGVTMGTEGMKASLVSRDLIADSIELVARGHMFDGIVALVACDKTIPAAAMALLRLNIPGVVLYGGSIMPGHYQGRDLTIQDVFEAVGANAAGKNYRRGAARDRERGVSRRRRLRRTVHRQHHGDRDGDDRPVADEHRCGAAGGSRARSKSRSAAARWSWMRCEQIAGRATIATRKAFENAIASVAATGGSTNAVLHLLAMAREAGVDLSLDDFQTISARTPLLVDLKPAGRFVAVDVDKAGGMAVIAKRLVDGGYVDGSALHRHRPHLRRRSRRREGDAGQEVIRPLSNPIKSTGGLVILKGNLAPEGGVIKVTGIDRKAAARSGARVRLRRRRHARRHQREDQGRRRGGDPL